MIMVITKFSLFSATRVVTCSVVVPQVTSTVARGGTKCFNRRWRGELVTLDLDKKLKNLINLDLKKKLNKLIIKGLCKMLNELINYDLSIGVAQIDCVVVSVCTRGWKNSCYIHQSQIKPDR